MDHELPTSAALRNIDMDDAEYTWPQSLPPATPTPIQGRSWADVAKWQLDNLTDRIGHLETMFHEFLVDREKQLELAKLGLNSDDQFPEDIRVDLSGLSDMMARLDVGSEDLKWDIGMSMIAVRHGEKIHALEILVHRLLSSEKLESIWKSAASEIAVHHDDRIRHLETLVHQLINGTAGEQDVSSGKPEPPPKPPKKNETDRPSTTQ